MQNAMLVSLFERLKVQNANIQNILVTLSASLTKPRSHAGRVIRRLTSRPAT